MPKSSSIAWAVRAAKAVLVAKVVRVADALVADALVADDLVVPMLRVEIRKAIALADLPLNRIRF